MTKWITKTDYVAGIRCPTWLWLKKYKPELIPDKKDESSQFNIDQGVYIGTLSTKLFPQGQLVQGDLFEGINNTTKLLEKRIPLFEAGFLFENLYVRTDILLPVGEDEWDIIEVKSSTNLKIEHIDDISFQKYVLEKLGLKIRNCFIMLLDTAYIRNKALDLEQLFKKEDVNIQVSLHLESIEDNLRTLQETLVKENEPGFCVCEFCFDKKCNFSEYCLKHISENSIFDINRYPKKKAIACYNNGIKHICDCNYDDFKGFQKIQVKATKENKVQIDKDKIKETLSTLEYPLYYFDFEGYTNALPLFEGTKVYQKVPFQYSLHIQEAPNSKVIHKEFLAEEGKDPRLDIITSMLKDLGNKGSIIVYNKIYESSVIRILQGAYPEHSKELENFISRLWDLIDIFSKGYYYNPKQCGSNSIKCILPLFSDLSYKNLDIGKGDIASIKFYAAGFGDFAGNKLSQEEIKKIRQNLLIYCKQDTLAMVLILEKLEGIVK